MRVASLCRVSHLVSQHLCPQSLKWDKTITFKGSCLGGDGVFLCLHLYRHPHPHPAHHFPLSVPHCRGLPWPWLPSRFGQMSESGRLRSGDWGCQGASSHPSFASRGANSGSGGNSAVAPGPAVASNHWLRVIYCCPLLPRPRVGNNSFQVTQSQFSS